MDTAGNMEGDAQISHWWRMETGKELGTKTAMADEATQSRAENLVPGQIDWVTRHTTCATRQKQSHTRP